jgi:hypothetical protein
MFPTRTILPVSCTAMLLSACVLTPEAYETDPVDVETTQGIVTCQLYTENLVSWDRSIDRPATMSVQEADAVCKSEGLRQKDAS